MRNMQLLDRFADISVMEVGELRGAIRRSDVRQLVETRFCRQLSRSEALFTLRFSSSLQTKKLKKQIHTTNCKFWFENVRLVTITQHKRWSWKTSWMEHRYLPDLRTKKHQTARHGAEIQFLVKAAHNFTTSRHTSSHVQ